MNLSNIPENYVTRTEILENAEFIDALKRYKSINGQNDFDIAKIEPLIRAVETIDSGKKKRITL